MRHLAMTGTETAAMISRIFFGEAIRATPPSARICAGTRSSAITATAPAFSAMVACAASVTSIMTPPFSISANPVFRRRLVRLPLFCDIVDLFSGSLRVDALLARRKFRNEMATEQFPSQLPSFYSSECLRGTPQKERPMDSGQKHSPRLIFDFRLSILDLSIEPRGAAQVDQSTIKNQESTISSLIHELGKHPVWIDGNKFTPAASQSLAFGIENLCPIDVRSALYLHFPRLDSQRLVQRHGLQVVHRDL